MIVIKNNKLQKKKTKKEIKKITKVDKMLKSVHQIEGLLESAEKVMVRIAIFILTLIGLITILIGKISG